MSIEEYRDSNVDSVRLIQVVEVKSLFGDGVEDSPCRQITQYYDTEGKLLATTDIWKKEADDSTPATDGSAKA